jgi:hypothetical protein
LVKIIPNEIPKSAQVGYHQIMFHGQKMKSICVHFRFLLAIAVFVTIAVSSPVFASAEDQVDQAVSASRAWVAQIDAGKYDDSYTFTCDETRDRFPQDRWVDVLKALRKPWGDVVSREQLSHIYKPNGVPGLNGECVVIKYQTTFKNLSNATEVVVLKWEDGKWLGAGYQAGPTPDPDAAPPVAANSSTQIQTDAHVKPQPQSPSQ